LFAILGMLMYYVGTFVGRVVSGILDVLPGIGFGWNSNWALGLVAIPFGIASVYLFHNILKKQCKKPCVALEDEIHCIENQIKKT